MRTLEIKSRGERHTRISVGIDNFDDGRGEVVGILWVPHLDFPEHEHIFLNKSEAKKLRDWLNEFLDEKVRRIQPNT